MDQAEKAKNLDTEKFNNQFYDYDFELSDFELSRIHKIVDMVGSHKRVLDIGCLDGTIGTFIQKKNNEVFGIDLSSAAVEKAQKKGIKASVGNAEKQLEFEDSSFDVICASEIIEHLYDTDKFLMEIHRVLKPNGKLILTTPNMATLSRRIKFLMGRDPGLEYSLRHSTSVGHIRFFIKSTITKLLEANGFQIDRIRTDMLQLGPIKSTVLGDLFPSFGKRFVILASPVNKV